MKPRLDIQFPFKRQWCYWFGKEYKPKDGEYLLNHARTGIVMALKASVPEGGRVGVVAYNCHTVANAVVNAGCKPVFVDVTERLTIDVESVSADLDAIVVTNLFGIRNDIEAIRKHLPNAIIIVDNAHGYGLPAEGDFTVYSINQGKFPALGPGGILRVNIKENKNKENTACAEENIKENDSKSKTRSQQSIGIDSYSIVPQTACEQAPRQSADQSYAIVESEDQLSATYKNTDLQSSQKNTKNIIEAIDEQYAALPSYRFMGQMKLFCSMLVKAIAYSRCMYWLTMKVKGMRELGSERIREKVVMKRMAAGVRRLYQAWLPSAASEIAKQRQNAERIRGLGVSGLGDEWLMGDNAFMLIARCENPEELKMWFANRGVETETHFKHAIDWAKQFGYIEGSCPMTERLTKELLMIPTYKRI